MPSFLLSSTHDGSHVLAVGSGKTAAFTICILQRIDTSNRDCQALVLSPSRELAQHIVTMFLALGEFMSVKIHACVGGTNIRDDIRTLKEGVHIVVGTPGRVSDMIKRGVLKLFAVQVTSHTLSVS